MHTTNPSYSDLKAPSPTQSGAARKEIAETSIHYAGAKETRIPMPYVYGGALVLAAIAYALKGVVHF